MHLLHLKGSFLWSPLSTSYPRACEWSEKWKSESIFGPLFFFNLRYIKGGVLGKNNIGVKKCRTIFLWVLNFGQVGGHQKFFQNHTATMIFQKWSQKLFFGKWSTFGTLNFFIFAYVKGGVRGNNNIGIKKCTTNFLWVLNFGQVGGRQ